MVTKEIKIKKDFFLSKFKLRKILKISKYNINKKITPKIIME